MNNYPTHVNSGTNMSKHTDDTTFSDRVQRNIKDISSNNLGSKSPFFSKESLPTQQKDIPIAAPSGNNYAMNQNWVHRGLNNTYIKKK
jgi:hypothetical protein